jgi:hypothetical protein
MLGVETIILHKVADSSSKAHASATLKTNATKFPHILIISWPAVAIISCSTTQKLLSEAANS